MTPPKKDEDLEDPTASEREQAVEVVPAEHSHRYPARLHVDYREDDIKRTEVLLRIFKIVPVLLLNILISSTLYLATLIVLVSRQKYPRWWFDFSLESKRYGTRCATFVALMTDKYPSTTDEQIAHLEVDFPGENVAGSLGRWSPLYKILLSIPHFFCVFGLKIVYLLALVVVWITLLIKGGKYPKFIFNFMVGVWRWNLRYDAYVFLLVTDEYPPFSLK